jgi:hypothetical protein
LFVADKVQSEGQTLLHWTFTFITTARMAPRAARQQTAILSPSPPRVTESHQFPEILRI